MFLAIFKEDDSAFVLYINYKLRDGIDADEHLHNVVYRVAKIASEQIIAFFAPFRQVEMTRRLVFLAHNFGSLIGAQLGPLITKNSKWSLFVTDFYGN